MNEIDKPTQEGQIEELSLEESASPPIIQGDPREMLTRADLHILLTYLEALNRQDYLPPDPEIDTDGDNEGKRKEERKAAEESEIDLSLLHFESYTKPLTREQELPITRSYQRIKHNFNELAERKSASDGTDEDQTAQIAHEEEQLIQVKKLIEDRLVRSNYGLITTIASGYKRQNSRLEIQDLFQEGSKGILIAADKFDPEMGYRFYTYAKVWSGKKLHDTLKIHLARYAFLSLLMP